ncbi:hypothetical protein BTN50_0718 [Candidatus Enterovibrio altilux]|uniref:Mobile element protein n=1 Tax=Candidatus Enterovibrio altilux TaxID=1927128 RepID=A0A291B8C2_9GAMM|nr:hypothetical protein BTN50_0718 [Candidatus Enterovibrio luxaltus]
MLSLFMHEQTSQNGNVMFKTKNEGSIQHLAIDFTGSKSTGR